MLTARRRWQPLEWPSLENAANAQELETYLRLIIDLNLVLTQYAELDGAQSEGEVADVEGRFELAMDETASSILAILGGCRSLRGRDQRIGIP